MRVEEEEEQRETMRQRQKWKPPLLQSTAALDSQTDTLCLSFIGPFRFITVAKSRAKLKRTSRIFDHGE